jgi:hypothetical protein
VRTASTRQYIPEDNSEHHTRRRENLKSHMIFDVLTAASMKMTAFLDIAPYSLVEVERRFRGALLPPVRGHKHPNDG